MELLHFKQTRLLCLMVSHRVDNRRWRQSLSCHDAQCRGGIECPLNMLANVASRQLILAMGADERPGIEKFVGLGIVAENN